MNYLTRQMELMEQLSALTIILAATDSLQQDLKAAPTDVTGCTLQHMAATGCGPVGARSRIQQIYLGLINS